MTETDTDTATRAILEQLKSRFDALRALSKDHLQAHHDTQELWKYTQELYTTLQAIAKLPEQYTDLISDEERLRIQTEHAQMMRDVQKMRQKMGTSAPQQPPKTKNTKQTTNTNLVRNVTAQVMAPNHKHDIGTYALLTTADTITPTTTPTTIPTTQSKPPTNITTDTHTVPMTDNARPIAADTDNALQTEKRNPLYDHSSVDDSADLLMSDDSSTQSDDSILHTSSSGNTSTTTTSTQPNIRVTFPQKRMRNIQHGATRQVSAHPDKHYTLMSLPKHNTMATDIDRKHKVQLVRQSGNGRLTPVTLQHRLYTDTAHQKKNRLQKIQSHHTHSKQSQPSTTS